MAYSGSGNMMHFLYNGSDTFANLPAFTTSSFYTAIEGLVEDAENTNGGTCSVAQTPGGKWYAKITFADNASKTAFKNWTNPDRATVVASIRSNRAQLPDGNAEWEDYLPTI